MALRHANSRSNRNTAGCFWELIRQVQELNISRFPSETTRYRSAENGEGGRRPGVLNKKGGGGEGQIVFAVGSRDGVAGRKAAAEEAFTFRWGGPGRLEREPSTQLGLSPDSSSSPRWRLGITGPGRGQAPETGRQRQQRLFLAVARPRLRRRAQGRRLC